MQVGISMMMHHAICELMCNATSIEAKGVRLIYNQYVPTNDTTFYPKKNRAIICSIVLFWIMHKKLSRQLGTLSKSRFIHNNIQWQRNRFSSQVNRASGWPGRLCTLGHNKQQYNNYTSYIISLQQQSLLECIKRQKPK